MALFTPLLSCNNTKFSRQNACCAWKFIMLNLEQLETPSLNARRSLTKAPTRSILTPFDAPWSQLSFAGLNVSLRPTVKELARFENCSYLPPLEQRWSYILKFCQHITRNKRSLIQASKFRQSQLLHELSSRTVKLFRSCKFW